MLSVVFTHDHPVIFFFKVYYMIDTFLKHLSLHRKYSPNTICAYRVDLYQFRDFIVEQYQHDVVEANLSQVRYWLSALVKGEGARTSINRKIVCLRQFFFFAMERGAVQVNPLERITALKQEKRSTLPLSIAEIKQVLDGISYTDNFVGVRKRFLLELLYGTGIRISEAMGIRWCDVMMAQNQIKILSKGSKERMIYISPKIKQALKKYLVHRKNISTTSDFLFITTQGKPLSRYTCYNMVKNSLALVTTKSKKSPHVLRHTFANHLLDGGADIGAVSKLMGHTSIASTQHYICTMTHKLKEVYKKGHPRQRV